ncbi:MAG TPA: hypothetical protein VFB23_09825 [Candidatus Acidoferrales bacterium]|nr:hypothetical protein [Candidatus Acidoferrales bacterium]
MSALAAVTGVALNDLAAEFAAGSAGAFPCEGEAGFTPAAVILGGFAGKFVGFAVDVVPLALEFALGVTAPDVEAEAGCLEAVEPGWTVADVDAGGFGFSALGTSGFAAWDFGTAGFVAAGCCLDAVVAFAGTAVEDGTCFVEEPFAAELLAGGAGFAVPGAVAGLW